MSDFKELPLAARGPIAQSPKSGDPIIGIDLGTTNSLAAIILRDPKNPKGDLEVMPQIIPSRVGGTMIPSVVHFDKSGSPQVGEAAKLQKILDASHTVFSAKRLLGRGLEDIKAISDQLPFILDAGPAAKDESAVGQERPSLDAPASASSITDESAVRASSINLKIRIGEKTYTPIEISALILKEIKASAEEFLGRSVEDAVITVPAYFNDSQRQATRAAGRLAGLNVLRIINEPTAASLAYGLQRKRNGLIAVYDLGGGTFDVSVLRLRDGVFEVLSTNGDTQLGGDDMDRILSRWIQSTVLSTYPQADLKSLNSKAILLDCAEKLKIILSSKENAVIDVPASVTGKEKLTIHLSQSEFKKHIFPLLERTKKPVEIALQDAGIAKEDLTDVVVVGGPSRLTLVRDYVKQLFGCEPNCSLNPDEVVALGAAIQADILAGNNKEFLLLDVVPLSLGIETFGGTMSKLIPRNTRIPSLAKESFTTYVDGQTNVAINVFQGERELVKDNRKLSEFILHGVPPLPAGVARIEVTFLVDADGILNVSAKEIYSEVEASVEVRPTYGLTDAEVEKMLEDGISHLESDRKAALLVDAKNDAHTILSATEKSLARIGSELESNEMHKIETLVDALKEKIKGDSLEEIKRAHKALNEGTLHLAEILMSQTLKEDVQNKRVSDILD